MGWDSGWKCFRCFWHYPPKDCILSIFESGTFCPDPCAVFFLPRGVIMNILLYRVSKGNRQGAICTHWTMCLIRPAMFRILQKSHLYPKRRIEVLSALVDPKHVCDCLKSKSKFSHKLIGTSPHRRCWFKNTEQNKACWESFVENRI